MADQFQWKYIRISMNEFHHFTLLSEPIVEKLRFFYSWFRCVSNVVIFDVNMWLRQLRQLRQQQNSYFIFETKKNNVLLPSHIAHSNVLSLQRGFVATFFSSILLSFSGIRCWKMVSDIKFRIEFKLKIGSFWF